MESLFLLWERRSVVNIMEVAYFDMHYLRHGSRDDESYKDLFKYKFSVRVASEIRL